MKHNIATKKTALRIDDQIGELDTIIRQVRTMLSFHREIGLNYSVSPELKIFLGQFPAKNFREKLSTKAKWRLSAPGFT